MTRHDILNLAVDADLVDPRDIGNSICKLSDDYLASLVTFAKLIASAEREACAKLCHNYARKAFNNSSQNAAMELRDAIRARGQE